ncbi:MAG TPA: hypothetical protein VGQ02_10310 [Candidatus Limnocylindrales bacterium]|nr:hypothetical protein [Candidatus Limnocylindrales bacterium]
MTTKRELDAIEGSLQPVEIVLRIIAEGQEHATLENYARAIAELPVESAPLTRIGTEVEASVRASMKGQDRESIERAVRKAVGDAIFRYILFLRLNTAALEIAEVEGPRASATFYWMGCLLGGPREDEVEADEWADHQAEQRDCWRAWRAVVASLYLTLMIEDEAREELEKRYLGGHEALLADASDAWDRFTDHVDRLWSLAETLAPKTEEEERLTTAAESYAMRLADRVQRLADDARIAAFERLGEMPRAVAIVERRLRSA